MNSKTVCVKCGLFLEQVLQGMTVMEMAHFGPYKLWRADLWDCPGCGLQIIAGFGDGPIAEHYETEKFATLRHAAEKRGKLITAGHDQKREERDDNNSRNHNQCRGGP